MSVHPRQPGASTPGAGKLPLPELYEMKRKVTVDDIYTERYLPPREELKFKL